MSKRTPSREIARLARFSTITEKGRAFDITDSKGHTARITIADVLQSNGVIHVINKVLMP